MGRRANGIAEIAQAASLLSTRIMREEGLGVAESDLLQLVRMQPGISQKEVCTRLGMDKGAVARRTVNLEQKDYLIRKSNPADAHSQVLYPTEKADSLKGTGTDAEEVFFDWLTEQLPEEERAHFCETVELLRERAVKESSDGYPNVCERLHRASFAPAKKSEVFDKERARFGAQSEEEAFPSEAGRRDEKTKRQRAGKSEQEAGERSPDAGEGDRSSDQKQSSRGGQKIPVRQGGESRRSGFCRLIQSFETQTEKRAGD